ncbi:hypothetical protein [Arthrobacter sp. UYCu723]
MNTSPGGNTGDSTSTAVSAPKDHRLRIVEVELLGGGRNIQLFPSLNFVRGDITTGKTTFVRLLRALLGTVPDVLPPEVGLVRALRGTVQLRRNTWHVYRPLVTTRTAPVEVARFDADDDTLSQEAVRLPASGAEASYSRFLLDQLTLPAVSVPEARTDPTSRLSAVSMTDWLGYCIVTGDELDSDVFGHKDRFKNQKRRWIFELAYGYYDVELAGLIARRRGVELRLDSLDREAEIIRRFLEDTPFSDATAIQGEISDKERVRNSLEEHQRTVAQETVDAAEVGDLRKAVLEHRKTQDNLQAEEAFLTTQLADLQELRRQLISQSARLTRAIVADEWLVDFDFVVCPRCGNSVESHRGGDGHCYLCLQPETSTTSRESLLTEQDRVISQVSETDRVLELRQLSLEKIGAQLLSNEAVLHRLSAELDQRTAAFVSDGAAIIRAQARDLATVSAEIEKLNDYASLVSRHQDHAQVRRELEEERDDISHAIESREASQHEADENLQALEKRMLDYLERLHIPQLGDLLTVRVNRTTYLPEISGRSFDELSSQGLKTLVNVAHALAHHTVAIDRGLPLPGLLVLDGISANAGREGFDRDRISDMYRLLIEVGEEYKDHLQLIAVDNDIPASIIEDVRGLIVLELSQQDRLIRVIPSNDA